MATTYNFDVSISSAVTGTPADRQDDGGRGTPRRQIS